MKEYIHQFYNEGLGLTFCKKPVSYLNKKIKNKYLKNILITLIKILYTILVLIFALIIFKYKWPL